MRITYRLTFADYYDAFRARNAKYRYIRQGAFAVMIVLVAVRMRPWTARDAYVLPLVMLVLLSFFGAFNWVERRSFTKAYKKSVASEAAKELTVEISEQGIRSPERTTTEWAQFSKYSETSNAFVLYEADSIYMILPKRAFNSSDMDEIRVLIVSKLKRF